MTAPLAALPEPPPMPVLGHLPRWGGEPLELLQEGVELARQYDLGLYRLRLGQPVVVGFTPDWNRRLLRDLPAFASAGSLSRIVPHLAGGIILTDAPEHRPRRATLNPAFERPNMVRLTERLQAACPPWPQQPFDALAWADRAVLRMLNAVYFSGRFDEELLHTFLKPLRQGFPAPLIPRPLTFQRFDAEVRRLARQNSTSSTGADLLAFLARLPDGLTEVRVSLAAAHDTTTHALAYAIWQLALQPHFHTPPGHAAVLKEVLRLYPPGWVGSRRTTRPVTHEGVNIPAGTLVLYSPFLTARDPHLWQEPLAFNPARWTQKPPAWAYLPFGGGERTCLGAHLAEHLILTTLAHLPPLRARWGFDVPQPGLTLGPRGPLWVERMPDWEAHARQAP